LDRFRQKAGAAQLTETAFDDGLGRATERHQGAGAPLDLVRRACHRLRVHIEDRHGPAGRCAQRGPTHADVARADDGHLAGNRQAIASSTWAPAGRTRSNNMRRTGAGYTSIATRVNEPLGSSLVRPRLGPSSSETARRRSLNVSTSGWIKYAIARTSLITAPSRPSSLLWNST